MKMSTIAQMNWKRKKKKKKKKKKNFFFFFFFYNFGARYFPKGLDYNRNYAYKQRSMRTFSDALVSTKTRLVLDGSYF